MSPFAGLFLLSSLWVRYVFNNFREAFTSKGLAQRVKSAKVRPFCFLVIKARDSVSAYSGASIQIADGHTLFAHDFMELESNHMLSPLPAPH